VVGRIVASRGIKVLGRGIAKVGRRGNTKDLLDDVGDFPQDCTEDDRRHAARGNAAIAAQSNQP
jgi:hypothetical protein